MYHDTGRPHFCAKSSASDVLPVPARPLIIVEVPEAMLFSSVSSKRDRETRGSRVGGAILSVITSSFAMARS